MSYDLCGVNGQHFRAASWSWHAMVSLICETGVLSKDDPVCVAGNDGYHVFGAIARAIADALDSRLAESPGIEEFTFDFLDGTCLDEDAIAYVSELPPLQVDVK